MGLRNVLQYVGLVSLFATTLCGGLLLMGEDRQIAFIGGGIVLVFVIYYLVKLMVEKKKETHSNLFHILILWILYIVIAFFGGIFSLHFITVQFIANDDLRANGKDKVDTIEKMQIEFQASVDTVTADFVMEVSGSLEAFLKVPLRRSAIKKEKEDELITFYKFSTRTLLSLSHENIQANTNDWIESWITVKIDKFKNEINHDLNEYHLKNKDVFKDMDYLSINKVYYELDAILDTAKRELEAGFRDVIIKYNKSDAAFTSLKIPPSTVPLDSLPGLRKQYISLKYIMYFGVFYLILQLLILSPFLLTKKKGKKPNSSEDEAPTL